MPHKKFPLVIATSETQTKVAQQQWQLIYGPARYSLQVIIESTPNHWQWIMMDNLGQRLATVSMENDMVKITQQRSHPAIKLLPELLEAMQFSFWPLVDLQRQSTVSTEWNFQAATQHRDIYFRGILRATVNYEDETPWQGKLVYDNKSTNFQLIIESQRLQ